MVWWREHVMDSDVAESRQDGKCAEVTPGRLPKQMPATLKFTLEINKREN